MPRRHLDNFFTACCDFWECWVSLMRTCLWFPSESVTGRSVRNGHGKNPTEPASKWGLFSDHAPSDYRAVKLEVDFKSVSRKLYFLVIKSQLLRCLFSQGRNRNFRRRLPEK